MAILRTAIVTGAILPYNSQVSANAKTSPLLCNCGHYQFINTDVMGIRDREYLIHNNCYNRKKVFCSNYKKKEESWTFRDDKPQAQEINKFIKLFLLNLWPRILSAFHTYVCSWYKFTKFMSIISYDLGGNWWHRLCTQFVLRHLARDCWTFFQWTFSYIFNFLNRFRCQENKFANKKGKFCLFWAHDVMKWNREDEKHTFNLLCISVKTTVFFYYYELWRYDIIKVTIYFILFQIEENKMSDKRI